MRTTRPVTASIFATLPSSPAIAHTKPALYTSDAVDLRLIVYSGALTVTRRGPGATYPATPEPFAYHTPLGAAVIGPRNEPYWYCHRAAGERQATRPEPGSIRRNAITRPTWQVAHHELAAKAS